MVKALVFIATVFSALLASGCSVSPETRARWAAEEQAKKDAYWARLKGICTRYGYREGTDSFAQCMQKESIAQDQQERAAQQAEHEHWKRLSCRAGNKWDCDTQPKTTNCRRNLDGTVTCVTE